MGYGHYTATAYTNYSTSVGRTLDDDGTIAGDYSAQEMFVNRRLDEALNPHNVMRECCDSEEHPHTRPVILALDVTGSMGDASVAVAKKLNPMMTKLYEEIPDIEFMTMAIGDLAYDEAPIQISQFESDVRIAEQLDKIYFEGGGGGNDYESYTAAWYMTLYHTKIDAIKRGYKPLIITMGDEPLNPYLPNWSLKSVVGDNLEGDIKTTDLYKKASEKFEIHHIAVGNSYRWYESEIGDTWGKLLGEKLHIATPETISDILTSIITDYYHKEGVETAPEPIIATSSGGIKW